MEWVKCSERVPVIGEFVFVCNNTLLSYGYLFFDGECWDDGDFFSGTELSDYTHWMKPEAPEGK